MIKKLPKATAQTFDDIRLGRDDARPIQAEAKKTSARRPRQASARAAGAGRTETPSPSPGPDRAKANGSIELRRAHAGQIVERYTAYSAVGSVIPIPLIDTLGVVMLNVSMVNALARLYETPFRRDRVRAAIAGLIGGAGQAGVGSVITLSLTKWVPGANLIGAAASSAASAALTRTIGQAFVLHFETGGTALKFDPATLRAHFERYRTAS